MSHRRVRHFIRELQSNGVAERFANEMTEAGRKQRNKLRWEGRSTVSLCNIYFVLMFKEFRVLPLWEEERPPKLGRV